MIWYTYFIYGEKIMTKIKKIYYPILAVLFVLVLTLGLVAAHVNLGSKADQSFVDDVRLIAEEIGMGKIHNSYEYSNQDNVRFAIWDKLTDNSIAEADYGSPEDGYEGAKLRTDKPTMIRQDVTLNSETIAAMQSSDDELTYVVSNLTNFIVVVPGKSANAVLFTANYDTAASSESGTESIQAAAMIKTIIDVAGEYENGNKPENTLVFVLTDAEHEGALGAYAFKYQFKGFDGIASKIKVAINFGAQGTGALAVTSSKMSATEVKGLSSGLNDAIDGTYEGVSDYDVYDVSKINVFFTGSREYINTSRDTIENVSDSKISAIGGVMKDLVDHYGYGAITKGRPATFSYMGITVAYSANVAYCAGGLAALFLILAVVALIFSGKKVSGIVRGVLMQLVAIIATAVILYACYLVLVLLLAGFGVVPINAIAAISYMNIGLFISCLILAFAAYAGVFLLLRRFVKIKATDAARGGALLMSIAGVVMAFAMPTASMPFVLVSLLESVALAVTSLLSKKFREKTGADIERLFAYTIPVILLAPAIIPIMMLAGYSLSVVYYPLIFIVAVLGFTTIAPYFGLLKPALSTVASKLPKHTIRVEKTVTEQVEGAKKGRYQEVTHKKVVKEKVEWQYRNRYGVALLGVLASILIILFAACPARHFDTNVVDTYSYRESVKNNSIVYYWEELGTGVAATEKYRIYDQVAYTYLARLDKGFKWDSSIGAYEKDFTGNTAAILDGVGPNVVIDSNSMVVKPYASANESFIDLKLSNLSRVSKMTIKPDRGDEIELDVGDYETFNLKLPYNSNDYQTFTITFEFTGSLEVGVDYYQYVTGKRTTQNMTESLQELVDIIDGFKRAGADFVDDISCGMIFHRQNTYTLNK